MNKIIIFIKTIGTDKDDISFPIMKWIRSMICLLGLRTIRCSYCGQIVEPSENKDYTYMCKLCDIDLSVGEYWYDPRTDSKEWYWS